MNARSPHSRRRAVSTASPHGGCVEKPYLSAGNANEAQVGYSHDLAAASEVARVHCARYEKVPRYLDSSNNIAYFACEHPSRGF